MTQLKILCSSAILLLLFFPPGARADWPCRPDSTVPIVDTAGNQWNVHLTGDGSSGAILVWQDRRDGITDKLFVQRVSASGNCLWQNHGIQLATSPGYQYFPQIVSDAFGGATIAWQDNRSGVDYDIYAQHVNSSGVSTWASNGQAVCTAAGQQYNPQIVPDGSGGVIIVWQDRRSGQYDIYAQRLSSSGQALWTANGQVVCAAPGDQVNPQLVADGAGGAIITWADYRGGSGFSDIYAQRILSNGSEAWATDGVSISAAANTQWNPAIATDGAAGAYILWQDRRSGTLDNIFCQWVNASGVVQWTTDGIPLAPIAGIQYYPQIVSDGSGGAIAVWEDNRHGSDYDIYGQRISASGQLLWSVTGAPICAAPGDQFNPQLVRQGSSVFVVWQDKRGQDYDIYGQRISVAGQTAWAQDGVKIASMPLDQFMPQLTSDSVQGAIVAWADYHRNTGSTDIFAHRIGVNGLPAGGCFRTFIQDSLGLKSRRFKKGSKIIIGIPNTGNVRDSVFGRGIFPNGVAVGIERFDSAKSYGWETFTRSLYVKRAFVQVGAPRPFDRIFERKFVGNMKNPSLVRYNNRLAGELLALKMNIAASDLGITQPGFGDLVFRDTAPMPAPIAGKKLRQVAAAVDSMLTLWKLYHGVNYTITANLLHKVNAAFSGAFDTISTAPLAVKSAGALFSLSFLYPSADPPTEVPAFQAVPVDPGVPSVFTLFQNYPNPFNPWTTIEFVLPDPAVVTMRVYDILGRVVSTPIDRQAMDDGHQVMDFNASKLASGIYFYQLIAEPRGGGAVRTGVKKMILMK